MSGTETSRTVVCGGVGTFNPIAAFSNMGKLADKRSTAGLSIWMEDPVHLTEAAYGNIASVLTGQAALLLTRSDQSQPAGRRTDSVVAGEGDYERIAVREPGWMSGTASTSGGRGRGLAGPTPRKQRPWLDRQPILPLLIQVKAKTKKR